MLSGLDGRGNGRVRRVLDREALLRHANCDDQAALLPVVHNASKLALEM